MNRTIRRLAMLLLSACAILLGNNIVHAEEELIVSAAASLTNAFAEVGKRFESLNPGIKAVFNFAASGPLLQQIEQGAPVDVFASADQKTMDQAQEKNLVYPRPERILPATAWFSSCRRTPSSPSTPWKISR